MGLYLIALTLSWELLWVILQVAIGLGAVIFVHELGHFLVAKFCGVQCDKFYVGFDIPIRLPWIGGLLRGTPLARPLERIGFQFYPDDSGLRLPTSLLKKQWGETEYGIGIVPLGGYVKMLGQDDNPANMSKEMERSRVQQEQGEGEVAAAEQAAPGEPVSAGGDAEGPPAAPEETPTAADAEEESGYQLNPRSYLAKSVPARMAIISAGVVMNVIFAFIFAMIAYWMGVTYLPCEVSRVVPGSPAWQADIRPGDQIERLGDEQHPRFRDLKTGVTLGSKSEGVELVIRRPGQDEPLTMNLKPHDSGGGPPTIGIMVPATLQLNADDPFAPDSAASRAEPPLAGGDKIVAGAGEPIATYAEFTRILARSADVPLRLTVERRPADGEGDARTLEIVIPPAPLKRLGLSMKMGKIKAVQQGSPAATAGLVAGDFLEKVDGRSGFDPILLPTELTRLAATGEKVLLTVSPAVKEGDSPKPQDNEVELRMPMSVEMPLKGTPLSAPALGIAYHVLNRVHQIEPGSPAEQSGILPNDSILQAKFVPREGDESKIAEQLAKRTIDFSTDAPNWPVFMELLQQVTPGMLVELTVQTGEETPRPVQLAAVDASGWHHAIRGMQFDVKRDKRQARSLREAAYFGWKETKDSLLMVFRFLQKLINGDLSPRLLGGPGTIATAAGYAAYEGASSLLIFLTMLSANLAVVNFLPIPMLDGGHMVFLALEGILRRPVSERIVVAFHTIGLVFILSLMLFVIALDVGLIARPF